MINIIKNTLISFTNKYKKLQISKLILLSSIVIINLFSSSVAEAALACDPKNNADGTQCASLWSVKFASRVSTFNYIWIIFLFCAVISVFLLVAAIKAFKEAGDGGQGNNLKKPFVLLILSGCMISLPHYARVIVNSTYGEGLSGVDDMQNNNLLKGDNSDTAVSDSIGGLTGGFSQLPNDDYQGMGKDRFKPN